MLLEHGWNPQKVVDLPLREKLIMAAIFSLEAERREEDARKQKAKLKK